MKTAIVIVKDDHHTYVACPYCTKTHRHGDVDKGMTLVSGCFQGEYVVGDRLNYEEVLLALSRRTKDIQRKKALRLAAKAAKEAEEK